jgi:glutamine amidotransferase
MPVLGICLGLEMFFEKSEEGRERGLNVIDGEVILLPNTMKIPHMGWNNLEIKQQSNFLNGIDDGSWVYFVHSYRVKPQKTGLVIAETDYGVKVPAIIEQKNFIGTQFHPEKSGKVGSLMLSNFLSECKK